MFVKIGIFSTTFVIVGTNGSIPSSTIENDLNELTKLHKEIFDRFPSISAHQAYEVRCRLVAICYPDEQENLYTVFMDTQFNEKCSLTY
jgi:hypothetical protein